MRFPDWDNTYQVRSFLSITGLMFGVIALFLAGIVDTLSAPYEYAASTGSSPIVIITYILGGIFTVIGAISTMMNVSSNYSDFSWMKKNVKD